MSSELGLLATDSEWWPDTAESMRQSVACKDMNMEVEELTVLGAITKQQLVHTQQTEKT
jgi:hypothetical protein